MVSVFRILENCRKQISYYSSSDGRISIECSYHIYYEWNSVFHLMYFKNIRIDSGSDQLMCDLFLFIDCRNS